jgi:hypothetical protein
MYRFMVFVALSLSLFVGCTSSSQHQISQPKQPYISPHSSNINDVDISDLEENLTETPIMMTQSGGVVQKLKRMPFPVEEYYALPQRGQGTIHGSVYLKDHYGSYVIGSMTRLYLNPITSYSKEWYEKSYLGGQQMEQADSKLYNYLKFTTSDSNGRFSFYGVPNGAYYLIATVKCGIRCGFESEKKIRLATKVAIRGNQVVQKDLSRDLRQ